MISPHEIPPTTTSDEKNQWQKLIDILRYLRSDDGCPWDKTQTIASLSPNLIEETSELLQEIGRVLDNPSDDTHADLQEEMGDVLLVLTMMMIIYDSDHPTVFARILAQLHEKLIRRHPHVFSNTVIESHEHHATQWETIKTKQEGKKKGPLKKHKDYMHILERTKEIQTRLSKDRALYQEPFTEKIQHYKKTISELSQLELDVPDDSYVPLPSHIEKTCGDALYQLIDILRTLKVSPTVALSRTLGSVLDRFNEN